MQVKMHQIMAALTLLGLAMAAWGQSMGTQIPMTTQGSRTFYISAKLAGLETTEFMVDTGSSYMTINQVTLERLQTRGQAEYLRNLTGVLANGDEMVVPVYRVPRIILGNRCELLDIEAAVFPGRTRQILGLNVLGKASPFVFSVDPPRLTLSNCSQQFSRSGQASLGPADIHTVRRSVTPRAQ